MNGHVVVENRLNLLSLVDVKLEGEGLLSEGILEGQGVQSEVEIAISKTENLRIDRQKGSLGHGVGGVGDGGGG